MEKLILVRFGSAPSPVVSAALAPHISGRAFAAPIPGAIMSVFNSPSNLETICDAIKETGAFFMLMRFNDVNLFMPEEIIEAINKVMGQLDRVETPSSQRDWSIDEILDLISANGIESLTPEQRRILDGRQ
jgi:hypothetical protein